MNYLSLYSGVGGGDLGLQIFLEWKCKGYVEWDKYCCRILEQRIKDGFLSDAPIFCGDIRNWFSEGYSELYKRKIDCITAGFPCQPFSAAGKQQGSEDERNLWPITVAIIDKIRPNFVLLENVANLVTFEYFTEIIESLAAIGYNLRWDVFSSAPLVDQKDGRRLWILASSISIGLERPRNTKQYDINSTITEIIPRTVQEASPRIYRRSDGISNYMDRIKPLGTRKFQQWQQLHLKVYTTVKNYIWSLKND